MTVYSHEISLKPKKDFCKNPFSVSAKFVLVVNPIQDTVTVESFNGETLNVKSFIVESLNAKSFNVESFNSENHVTANHLTAKIFKSQIL
jgi:hypothetical protein